VGIVRGTTRYQHAIIQKKIINHDSGTGRHVICSWSDCEKDGFELYKVRVNTGTVDQPRVMNYAFCSERCKQYWLHDSRGQGGNNLPSGYKRSILVGSGHKSLGPHALSSIIIGRVMGLPHGALFIRQEITRGICEAWSSHLGECSHPWNNVETPAISLGRVR
jgi:hypothetical protein